MLDFRRWVSSQLVSNKFLSARPFRFSDDDITNEEASSRGILLLWISMKISSCFSFSYEFLSLVLHILIYFTNWVCACEDFWLVCMPVYCVNLGLCLWGIAMFFLVDLAWMDLYGMQLHVFLLINHILVTFAMFFL